MAIDGGASCRCRRVRGGVVALVLLCGAPGAAAANGATIGEVSYVHAEGLFLRLAPEAGLAAGDVVVITGRGDNRARAELEEVLPGRGRARLTEAAVWVRPGDPVIRAKQAGRRAPPPSEAPAPTVAPAPSAGPAVVADVPPAWPWGDEPYAKVDRQRSIPGPALRPMRTRAALRGTGWLWLEREDGNFQRDSLDLVISGPLDDDGDFVLDADLHLTGQLLVPADARDRADPTVYFDLYRANLAYYGWDPFWLAAGRRPLPSLRWGLVDGAAAGWRFTDGPTVEVALGVRPDPDTLWPEHFRPVASFGVNGQVAWEPAQLSYRFGASWLGVDDMTSEGLEAGAAVVLDALGWLGLDTEVGLLALFPPGGEASVNVDRVSAGVSTRIGDRVLVRLAGRRLDTTALLSDLTLLPTAFWGGTPYWDVASYVDLYLGEWGAAATDGALSGGVMVDETSGDVRGWVAPAMTWRLPRLYGARVRVGYRADIGDVGGHLGELSLGIEPVDGLRLDLWQQGGVWALVASKSLLPTGATWLRVAWQPLAWLEVDLRGRALYGETGSGFVLDARVAAIDFW